jgi:predicted acetyltransferase
MVDRPACQWPLWEGHYRRSPGLVTLVVHRDGGDIDGYAMCRVTVDGDAPAEMHVEDMVAATDQAFADLWRHLLRVDLVGRITAPCRPLDEPLEALLTDSRACEVTSTSDDLWLRVVDVPSALAARGRDGDGSVVIAVADPRRPANPGRYRVSHDGVDRVDTRPQLAMDVAALGMLCLGEWRVRQLAAVGLVDVLDQPAVEVADGLLATSTSPWCGTFF